MSSADITVKSIDSKENSYFRGVKSSVIQWEWTLTLNAADMDRSGASMSVKYRRRWEYIAISWKLFASVYLAEGASARPNCTPRDPDQASLLDV